MFGLNFIIPTSTILLKKFLWLITWPIFLFIPTTKLLWIFWSTSLSVFLVFLSILFFFCLIDFVFKLTISQREIIYFLVSILFLLTVTLIKNFTIGPILFDFWFNRFKIGLFSSFFFILILFLLVLALVNFYFYAQSSYINFNEAVILLITLILAAFYFFIANNLIDFYLSFELQALLSYILIALKTFKLLAIESSIKYFIYGLVSGSLLLFGFMFIYLATGSIDFEILSLINKFLIKIGTEQVIVLNLSMLVGLTLILLGLLIKTGAAPFHFWVPDVYQGSGSGFLPLLMVIQKIIVLFGLLRLYSICFLTSTNSIWFDLLTFCGVISICVGTFLSLGQLNLKRLLSYSGIVHMGFILLSLSCGSTFLPIFSSLLYLLIYSLNLMGLLMLMTLSRNYLASGFSGNSLRLITDLRLYYKRFPFLGSSMALLLFSMLGLPPFAGFFGKYFVIITLLDHHSFLIAFLVLILTAFSSFYYLRVIKIIFFDFINLTSVSGLDSNFFKESVFKKTDSLQQSLVDDKCFGRYTVTINNVGLRGFLFYFQLYGIFIILLFNVLFFTFQTSIYYPLVAVVNFIIFNA